MTGMKWLNVLLTHWNQLAGTCGFGSASPRGQRRPVLLKRAEVKSEHRGAWRSGVDVRPRHASRRSSCIFPQSHTKRQRLCRRGGDGVLQVGLEEWPPWPSCPVGLASGAQCGADGFLPWSGKTTDLIRNSVWGEVGRKGVTWQEQRWHVIPQREAQLQPTCAGGAARSQSGSVWLSSSCLLSCLCQLRYNRNKQESSLKQPFTTWLWAAPSESIRKSVAFAYKIWFLYCSIFMSNCSLWFNSFYRPFGAFKKEKTRL